MENIITGRIYILKSFKTENIYIGSTIQTIKHRLSQHKSDYKRYNNNAHKEEIKEYNQLNKEKHKLYMREYRKNKNIIQ